MGKHDEAIGLYRAHMEERQQLTSRPVWENPSFYLLLIGDIELNKDAPQEAHSRYLEAAARGIHPSLMSDRIRSLARWYEERARLREAFDLLAAHRELDTLLFDAMLDRIGKAMTKAENAAQAMQFSHPTGR
jgi:hypothetical protein